MLAFNCLGIECKTRDIMMQLYKNFDQAAIGGFCTVLVVSLQTYLEALESLQVFTRILPGSVGISYKERLDKLRLFSLECHRLRGKLMGINKIIKV